MIIFGIVLFILSFFIHDIAKALADARWDDTGDTPLHRWAIAKGKDNYRWKWYKGISDFPELFTGKQGNPFKCDFWHLWDGHVRIFAVWLGGLGYGTACWFSAIEYVKNGMVFGWWSISPLEAIPIGFVAYWVAGNIFKYLFHVKYMGDWTVQKFWSEVF